MTDYLSLCNRFSGAPLTDRAAILPGMPEASEKKVGERLRALMLDPELGADTVGRFAKLIGAERNAASAWLNGYNFPRVPSMGRLMDLYPGLTLDWIYFGIPDAVPVKLYIKLQALLEKAAIPLVLSEREAPPEGSAPRATAKRSPASRKKATVRR